MKIAALLFLIFASVPAYAGDMPYGFLVGEYELVGKMEHGELYSGDVTIAESPDGVSVTRIINGFKTVGVGKFENITADNIQVLKVRFSEGKVKPEDTYYNEVTYELHSTAGNYPVLTGHVYMPALSSLHKPGLETLYFKDGATY
jgi:hypothetical protein